MSQGRFFPVGTVRGATVTADLSSMPPERLHGGVTSRVPLLVAGAAFALGKFTPGQ
jgi:hypothetical protein